MMVVEKVNNVDQLTETGSATAVRCLVHVLFLLHLCHYDRIWGTYALRVGLPPPTWEPHGVVSGQRSRSLPLNNLQLQRRSHCIVLHMCGMGSVTGHERNMGQAFICVYNAHPGLSLSKFLASTWLHLCHGRESALLMVQAALPPSRPFYTYTLCLFHKSHQVGLTPRFFLLWSLRSKLPPHLESLLVIRFLSFSRDLKALLRRVQDDLNLLHEAILLLFDGRVRLHGILD